MELWTLGHRQDPRKYPEPVTRSIGRVVISKPFGVTCPAELTLGVEGIEYETHSVSFSDFSYASVLTGVWQVQSEFINLEHDVAPWPGALDQLHDCPEPFCFFQYPFWPAYHLGTGIGCMKFGQAVLDAIPESWENWGNLSWWDLDGAVVADVLGSGFKAHQHGPPVAHVRRPMIRMD